MKKIILFLIALQYCLSFGQNSPCVNDVSTHPESPTNSALPLDTNVNIAFDSLFLNNFDWIPFGSQNNLMDLQTVGLPALGASQEMRSLYNNGSFYGYINSELMMPSATDPGVIPNHQHGWELIGVNLGFFPDNTPFTAVQNISNQHPRMPYVILYNRYLSKIRVFVNIHDQWAVGTNYSAARIRLTLNTENDRDLNGLFRLQDGMDRTLDMPTKVRSAGVLVGAPNDKQRWLIGDFTVAFDPCVCDYPSAFNLDVELIKNIDFQLYGRGISTEEEIVDTSGNFVNSNFLSGVSIDVADPELNQGGFVMYKKMEDLFDDYVNRMEYYDSTLASVNQHNDRVDRNLAIVKWVKYAIKVGVTAATGGSSIAIPLIDSLLTHAPDLFGQNPTGAGLSDNWEKAFKEAEEIIGTEVMTFINDNFKKQEKPTVPNKPTANFSEMYFEGRLTQVDPKTGPMIYTPGTYGNSINTFLPDQHAYPVYNEPLGVFALLEKPKVDISYTYDYNGFTTVNVPSITYTALNAGGDIVHIPFENATKVFREHITQISLKDDLKYTFNPALDIKDYSIQASLVFDVSVENPNPRPHPMINSQGVMLNHDPNYSVIYPPVKTDIHDVNIESISFNVGETTILDLGDTYDVSTVYTPIDAFKGLTASIGMVDERIYLGSYQYALNEGWILEDDRNLAILDNIYLKLLINVTYEGEKSDGSPHEYTYMFTYKIDEIDWDLENPLYPSLFSSSSNLGNFEYDLELNGANFNGQNIDGCVLENNTYLCKAENNVELQGTFMVNAGYEVIVQAANEINVLPESVIPPEMTLQIGPFHDLSNPMPPVDAAYVQNFCQDENEYKARSGMIAYTDTDSIPSAEEREEDHFAFNVFPNPTSGRTTVSITLNEAAVGELFITAINGRRLGSAFANQRLPEGKSEHQLPTERLASGIYLVHLVVDGERHVKRLVKQ